MNTDLLMKVLDKAASLTEAKEFLANLAKLQSEPARQAQPQRPINQAAKPTRKRRERQSFRFWSTGDQALLAAMWNDLNNHPTASSIARALGRSVAQVYYKATQMGLGPRTPEGAAWAARMQAAKMRTAGKTA